MFPKQTFDLFKEYYIDEEGDMAWADQQLELIEKFGINNSDIKWNFIKFVVDRNGDVTSRLEPTAGLEIMEEKIKEVI